ncbi:hypothetical protein [Botrimarina hoheduenensis]|uniref:Alpha/beta hydrolase family protein n=1 Tax=Botrimarina hoheduenensis TaxID=2528000 RepID=A0A5C5VXU6_9BACT|nr:hypothetical protein [Botrimarina hoheduenensis]TWT43264.1 hypothetical protein Pla111_22140 [Botrimarina hoheduenensis]
MWRGVGFRKRLIAYGCGMLFPCVAAPALLAEPGRELSMSRPEWRLYLPPGVGVNSAKQIDLLVHFHGDPATVRANVAAARLNAAVVTANYNGLSSAYRVPFEDPQRFQALLDDALNGLQDDAAPGQPVDWGTVCVSSFSAGYGAVRELLKVPAYIERIDGILAADSLYASTDSDGTPVDEQMAGYLAYARRAVAGGKTFLLTHTEVPTPTYESTRDTADEILAALGLEARSADSAGLGPLTFTRIASAGNFKLWGSPGETGEAHMQHLRYMAEWLDDLPLAKLPCETP